MQPLASAPPRGLAEFVTVDFVLFFVIPSTSEETWTLPLGPLEPGEAHFAPNCLGVSLYIARVWTKDVGPFYLCVFTRVLEKTAKFSLCIKEMLLTWCKEKGLLRPWMELKNRADGGGSFRAVEALAHSAIRLPELF